jgi:hypothetical protein
VSVVEDGRQMLSTRGLQLKAVRRRSGIQKVEESGSEEKRQGLEERRRSGKVSELETLAD